LKKVRVDGRVGRGGPQKKAKEEGRMASFKKNMIGQGGSFDGINDIQEVGERRNNKKRKKRSLTKDKPKKKNGMRRPDWRGKRKETGGGGRQAI